MSDLVDECGQDLSACGYETIELGKFDATCNRLFVQTSSQTKALGFDKGHYFILNAPLLPLLMNEHEKLLKDEILTRLRFLLKQNKIKKSDKVLFVGIGNPQIVADSFGVRAVEKIPISPFKKNNKRFKIMPNVFTNTGLNAYEIIRLVVEAFDISAVMLFDSLATTTLARLGCSIQFNDSGLTPGSAINNFGMPINRHSLNVPCIAVGVPMMISSKSLGAKREVILTDKGVDEQVEFLANLLAQVLDEVF